MQKQTKKNTESIDPKVSATSNGKTMKLSKCGICGSKKSKIIKKQEAKGLLSNLGIRTPLDKIQILGDVNSNIFMPEMHLRQLGFT